MATLADLLKINYILVQQTIDSAAGSVKAILGINGYLMNMEKLKSFKFSENDLAVVRTLYDSIRWIEMKERRVEVEAMKCLAGANNYYSDMYHLNKPYVPMSQDIM